MRVPLEWRKASRAGAVFAEPLGDYNPNTPRCNWSNPKQTRATTDTLSRARFTFGPSRLAVPKSTISPPIVVTIAV